MKIAQDVKKWQRDLLEESARNVLVAAAKYFEHYGAEHAEGCAEDATCSCLVSNLGKALHDLEQLCGGRKAK